MMSLSSLLAFLVKKYNPYHDERGRFASKGSAHFVSTSGVFKPFAARQAAAHASKKAKAAKLKAKAKAKAAAAAKPATSESGNTLPKYSGTKSKALLAHDDPSLGKTWRKSRRAGQRVYISQDGMIKKDGDGWLVTHANGGTGWVANGIGADLRAKLRELAKEADPRGMEELKPILEAKAKLKADKAAAKLAAKAKAEGHLTVEQHHAAFAKVAERIPGITDDAKAMWIERHPAVSIDTLTDAFLGTGVGTANNRATLRIYGNGLRFDAHDVKNDGATYRITRTFRPNGDVHHDYLTVDKSSQGNGVVKRIFANAIPLYQKMGMKSISVYANIDAGGYAWARYGFDQEHTEFKNVASLGVSNAARIIKHNGKGSEATKAEYDALKAVFAAQGSNKRLPQLVTGLSLPELDKASYELYPDGDKMKGMGAKGSFLRRALRGASWNGNIKFSDSEQMETVNTYLGISSTAKKKKKTVPKAMAA